MKEEAIIVLDCGATNVRAITVCTDGKILAAEQEPNCTRADPLYSGGIIWDIEEIWSKISGCIQRVLRHPDLISVKALTLTTFGVNGAPVDARGSLLYPVISWQCQRTVPYMESASNEVPFPELYARSGIHQYSFNTLYVLLWLRDHHPDILQRMEGFLFISSLLVHRLTGVQVNDVTMAGTSMLTDIHERKIASGLLAAFGLPDKFFDLAEPGTQVGAITEKAAKETGLDKGIPVIIGGHDTQFALLGSGAGENELVLSSGTWEILMTRSQKADLGDAAREAGLTNEMDVVPGLYNIGKQWLASGVIEWIKQQFYTTEMKACGKDIYSIMQSEGVQAVQDPGGVVFQPDLANNRGMVSGIGLKTSRGQIYLAALDALAEKTKEARELLEASGGFRAESLIIAGGGSRNTLWNQIRANKLGIPVKCVCQPETTVMGAALVALTSLKYFQSLEEGADALVRTYETVYPE